MKIKVIHIVTRINFGGLTTFIYNYYKHIDRSKIQFDIVAIDTGVKHDYHSKFEELGANVYYMPENILARAKYLINLFSQNHYHIAHAHIEVQSSIYLLLAKFCGIKVRISHAHWSKQNLGLKNNLLRFILNNVVTLRAGASKIAMDAVFGSRLAKKGVVIHNAVDLNYFKYEPNIRNEIRNDLNIYNKLVVGFFGRLTYQKNINYVIEVFHKLSIDREDIILLVIGDGEDAEFMNNKLRSLGLIDKLIWLKVRDDVNNFYSVIDVLLLPSYFEGLPLVLVEAQASSVYSVVSDNITKQVNLTPYIKYLPIKDDNVSEWVESIVTQCNDYPRLSTMKELSEKGFNINIEADNLYKLYESLVNIN